MMNNNLFCALLLCAIYHSGCIISSLELKIDIHDRSIAKVEQEMLKMNPLLASIPGTEITYFITEEGMVLIYTKSVSGPIQQYKENIDFKNPYSETMDSTSLGKIITIAKYLHQHSIDGAWLSQCLEGNIFSYDTYYKDKERESSTTFGITISNEDLEQCYKVHDRKGNLKLLGRK